MQKTMKAIDRLNPLIKGLLIVLFAYIVIQISTNKVNASNEITGYKNTVTIQVEDGTKGVKKYLVKQDTVLNVLNQLNITLNEGDTLNLDTNYVVKNKDLIQILRISTSETKTQSVINYTTEYVQGKNLFTTETIQNGENGIQENVYINTYVNRVLKAQTLVTTNVIKPAKNTVVSTGTVQAGAYFTGKLTYYGGDATGSNGTSSSGVSLSATTGVMNSNSPYLVIGGQKYYCLAADPSIPFGTVIKITNHNLSVPSTIYGIVVDRGGAIKKNVVDIFIGSEKGGVKYFTGGTSYNTRFEIVSVGSGKNFWKAYY